MIRDSFISLHGSNDDEYEVGEAHESYQWKQEHTNRYERKYGRNDNESDHVYSRGNLKV